MEEGKKKSPLFKNLSEALVSKVDAAHTQELNKE